MESIEAINLGFVFLCGVLVVKMQLGFAMLETGLNSHLNAANILFKNIADLSIGALMYWFCGYRIMFPEAYEDSSQWFGLPDTPGAGIEWFYQMAFAATAATIVSGAVAGRMKFRAYLIYSGVLTGFVYPVAGRFLWSETGLYSDGFVDFAGSIVVHGVGGAAALAAITVLRPRKLRFSPLVEFVGHHNLVYALLGTMLLWVGWYGFNGGSISYLASSDPLEQKEAIESLSRVLVSTTVGAAAGALTAMFAGLFPYKGKLNLKAAMNGALGGLVSITASCNAIEPREAIVAGAVGGLLVIVIEWLMEKTRKLDDTVGAVPVHLVGGLWGGACVVIFSDETTLGGQLPGVFVLFGVYVCMLILFFVIKVCRSLEVSEDEEEKGLDKVEHDLKAYYPSLAGD